MEVKTCVLSQHEVPESLKGQGRVEEVLVDNDHAGYVVDGPHGWTAYKWMTYNGSTGDFLLRGGVMWQAAVNDIVWEHTPEGQSWVKALRKAVSTPA